MVGKKGFEILSSSASENVAMGDVSSSFKMKSTRALRKQHTLRTQIILDHFFLSFFRNFSAFRRFNFDGYLLTFPSRSSYDKSELGRYKLGTVRCNVISGEGLRHIG